MSLLWPGDIRLIDAVGSEKLSPMPVFTIASPQALQKSVVTRMQSWKIPEIKAGDMVSAVGFTSKDEAGEAILRVEYLFVGNNTYGLRSSPA